MLQGMGLMPESPTRAAPDQLPTSPLAPVLASTSPAAGVWLLASCVSPADRAQNLYRNHGKRLSCGARQNRDARRSCDTKMCTSPLAPVLASSSPAAGARLFNVYMSPHT